MKHTLFIVGLLLATTNANAQTSLTLDQCVTAAIENNVKLRNANRSIEMASEQRKEALTKYFPTVSATGMGMAANENLIEMDVMGMGIGMVKNGVAANVSVMQPVFAGGQIVNGNKLARVGEEASKLQRGLAENEVRLNAETYYWQIVALKEKLITIGNLERQIAQVHSDAQAAVDAGVRNRNDLLQVELRQGEIRTARLQAENGLAIMRDLLAQYIGRPHDSIDVVATVGTELPPSPQSLYVDPQTALASTREYQLLGKQVEAERLNYRMEVGKNMPTVAVGGAYLYNDLMDKSSNKLVGLVTVNVPISSWWGGSHAMKRQKLSMETAADNQRDQSELLVIRMRKAWTDATDAYARLGIAKESITQSEENLRLNTDYYQAGTASISDLLDAQTLYQQAHDKYVEALTQYETKKTEYLVATGR